jgi:hypothetical protein
LKDLRTAVFVKSYGFHGIGELRLDRSGELRRRFDFVKERDHSIRASRVFLSLHAAVDLNRLHAGH